MKLFGLFRLQHLIFFSFVIRGAHLYSKCDMEMSKKNSMSSCNILTFWNTTAHKFTN